MSNQVPAQLYDFEYITDFVHNSRNRIKEIFIPSLNICFNTGEGQLNVFRKNKSRNKICQIKTKWSERALEEAKTDPEFAKKIEEEKRKEKPEERTPITNINLDQSFVDNLLEILKTKEFTFQVKLSAEQYLK
jgi:hypothetical protein